MFWHGCRGCGWMTEPNVAGVMTNRDSRCQFCNYFPVSVFDGTAEEHEDMRKNGLIEDP
jgi:hypothetical protein